MEEVCGGARPYLQTTLLEAEHARVKDKALLAFRAKRKMGGDDFSKAYCDQLLLVIRYGFVMLKAIYSTHNHTYKKTHKTQIDIR